MNKKLQIIVAILLGVFAAIMVAGYMTSVENRYKMGVKKVSVLVSKRYIDAGELISPDDVEVKEVPAQYLQPRALRREKDLLTPKGGILYMAAVPIDKGEQIIGTKLFALGMGTGLGPVIPPGFRAITINAEKVDVVNVIVPGNRVDIIGIFDYDDKEGKTHVVAKTLLQNVLVLSVGKAVLGSITEVTFKSKKQAEKALMRAQQSGGGSIAVGLAVTPAQAELLSLAKTKGIITFAVRGVGDTIMPNLPGISLENLFANYGKKAGKKYSKYLEELKKQQEEALKLLKKYGYTK